MERLYAAITRERSRLFVGREAELAVLDQWLAAPEAPTSVFSVTGMGGIGKSTLLLQMLERARKRGVAGLWIDGRACTRTPAGFLAYLTTVIGSRDRSPLDSLPADGVSVSTFVPEPGGRSIWCIDNYEELEPLDGWLRERFFAEFPSVGHLIVLASRQALAESWRSDPGWRRRLRALPLEPLTRSQSRTYLRRAGVAAGRIEELARGTGGLPLALALAADALTRRPGALQEVGRPAIRSVSARLLREAAGGAEGALEPLLELLAVVPEADPELLGRVLGEPVSGERLLSLARLSFVQSSSSGFRLHDVARRYLMAELRERDPGCFKRIRRIAVRALLHRLESARKGGRASLAASLLAMCADALPSVDAYATLSPWSGGAVRTASPRDLPALHRLVDGWGRQPFALQVRERYHQLLDRVVREFPEGARVVQGGSGEPLACLIALLLHGETVGCLDSVEEGALARHMPEECARLAALPAEEADTYLALMVGANPQSEEYSEQELLGLLIRDGLAHLGEGTRALVGASHPNLRQLLERLGFTEYVPGTLASAAEAGQGQRRLYELDLRHGRFGPWVLSFLEAVEGGAVWAARADTVSVLALRKLLTAFDETPVWETSPVPGALGCEAVVLRARLRKVLAGREPLSFPFTTYDREILFQTYLHRLAPGAVASNLHVSRATYYRHLQRALEHLREALVSEAG